MTANEVPSPSLSSPGTTAYCEASPSPESPNSRNVKSPAICLFIRKSGSTPRSRCDATQRRRTSEEGSPNRPARISFLDRHKVAGLSQVKLCLLGRSDWNEPICWQLQPAPSSETRDDTSLPRAAAISPMPQYWPAGASNEYQPPQPAITPTPTPTRRPRQPHPATPPRLSRRCLTWRCLSRGCLTWRCLRRGRSELREGVRPFPVCPSDPRRAEQTVSFG